MRHFAKVVDVKLTQVIVADPDFFTTFADTGLDDWNKETQEWIEINQ
jgi:hypothetical protein